MRGERVATPGYVICNPFAVAAGSKEQQRMRLVESITYPSQPNELLLSKFQIAVKDDCINVEETET